jgi:hypothetical protein
MIFKDRNDLVTSRQLNIKVYILNKHEGCYFKLMLLVSPLYSSCVLCECSCNDVAFSRLHLLHLCCTSSLFADESMQLHKHFVLLKNSSEEIFIGISSKHEK